MDGVEMDSSGSSLSALQREIIARFFLGEQEFWLTGGAALAGYYFGHRVTHDVDLFGSDSADIESAVRKVEEIGKSLGAAVTRLRTSPSFVRLLVALGDDRCDVDVVRDGTPRSAPVDERDGIRIDPLRELAARKMAALVSRSEVRDLVDLHQMALAGVDLDLAFDDACAKDAGMSPDTLAMSLSWIALDEVGSLLADVDVETIRRFREALEKRFRARAFPGL